MLAEGESAPEFELLGVVDGNIQRVSLADSIGEAVVIIAFYPGDFNPACSEAESDLDDLDLFTMQTEVSVIAVSADSVYSHRAFADTYDLQVPLLSDLRAEVAADYGVTAEDPSAGHLIGRAVFVVGLEGDIEFAWSTDDVDQPPPIARIRNSADGVGAGGVADGRYTDGQARFVEGSRQFDDGEAAFDEERWAGARGTFEQAAAALASAAEAFHTARRIAEDEEKQVYFERAEEQAETFAQAAEWLAKSAAAFDRGDAAAGMALQEGAQGPLEAARAGHDPVPPEDFPPTKDPAPEGEGAGGVSPGSTGVDSLDLELDAELAEGSTDADPGPGTDGWVDADGTSTAASSDGEEDEEDIADEELAEITAELADQTGPEPDRSAAAVGTDEDSRSGGAVHTGSGEADATGEAAATSGGGSDPKAEGGEGEDGTGEGERGESGEQDGDGDLELDLTDPSAGEDELLEPTKLEVDDEEEEEEG